MPCVPPGRSAGDVDEGAFSGIAKQSILTHRGDEQIGESVVVEIADRDAHAVHLDIEPGASCHVRERAIAIVAIQLQGRALRL